MPADRDDETPKAYAPPPWPVALLRLAGRLAAIGALALVAVLLFHQAMALADALPIERRGIARAALIVASLAVYALLISLPFVPGIEIGLALLMTGGAALAPFVYLATLGGLGLAYLAGRYMPLGWLRRLMEDLHLRRGCALIDEIAPLSGAQRLALMRSRLPRWLAPALLRWRYVTLGVLINLPGSGLIGGGGGICLLAGASGVFAPRTTALTLAVAVLPLPLVVMLTRAAAGG